MIVSRYHLVVDIGLPLIHYIQLKAIGIDGICEVAQIILGAELNVHLAISGDSYYFNLRLFRLTYLDGNCVSPLNDQREIVDSRDRIAVCEIDFDIIYTGLDI